MNYRDVSEVDMRECGDKTLPVWRLVTGNVSVCTYVGGGGVVGGRASSASANSWESQQSIPVSLGRDQRYQTIKSLLHYFCIDFHYFCRSTFIWILRIESALLRVLSSRPSWLIRGWMREVCQRRSLNFRLP